MIFQQILKKNARNNARAFLKNILYQNFTFPGLVKLPF
jgi:hypothetical protein